MKQSHTSLQILERLVLGCIDSYDSEKRCILYHFVALLEIYKNCILLHR